MMSAILSSQLHSKASSEYLTNVENIVEFDEPEKVVSTVVEDLKKLSGRCGRVVLLNPSIRQSSQQNNGSTSDASTSPLVLHKTSQIHVGFDRKVNVGRSSGMINMGNTCYLNSTLQAIFHIPSLYNYLNGSVDICDSLSHVMSSGKTPTHTKRTCQSARSVKGLSDCLICALTETLRNSFSSGGTSPTRPAGIYRRLHSICKTMVQGRQEDAHEFLRYLVQGLQKSFLTFVRHSWSDERILSSLKRSNGPSSSDAASVGVECAETTPFNCIFGGTLRQEITCSHCDHVSITHQKFMDLNLDIRNASNINEAISQHFKAEIIGSVNTPPTSLYKCERCKKSVVVKKKSYLQTPPVVLCLNLKRFTLFGTKIVKPITLFQNITLDRYVKKGMTPKATNNFIGPQFVPQTSVSQTNVTSNGDSPSPLTYSLVSLITHVGSSPNCGHYTAIGRTSTGQYCQFDDAYVRNVSTDHVFNSSSYVIFYEISRQSKQVWLDDKKDLVGSTTKTEVSRKLIDVNYIAEERVKGINSVSNSGIVQTNGMVSIEEKVTSIKTANKIEESPKEENDTTVNVNLSKYKFLPRILSTSSITSLPPSSTPSLPSKVDEKHQQRAEKNESEPKKDQKNTSDLIVSDQSIKSDRPIDESIKTELISTNTNPTCHKPLQTSSPPSMNGVNKKIYNNVNKWRISPAVQNTSDSNKNASAFWSSERRETESNASSNSSKSTSSSSSSSTKNKWKVIDMVSAESAPHEGDEEESADTIISDLRRECAKLKSADWNSQSMKSDGDGERERTYTRKHSRSSSKYKNDFDSDMESYNRDIDRGKCYASSAKKFKKHRFVNSNFESSPSSPSQQRRGEEVPSPFSKRRNSFDHQSSPSSYHNHRSNNVFDRYQLDSNNRQHHSNSRNVGYRNGDSRRSSSSSTYASSSNREPSTSFNSCSYGMKRSFSFNHHINRPHQHSVVKHTLY